MLTSLSTLLGRLEKEKREMAALRKARVAFSYHSRLGIPLGLFVHPLKLYGRRLREGPGFFFQRCGSVLVWLWSLGPVVLGFGGPVVWRSRGQPVPLNCCNLQHLKRS